jgi:SSS family solute:Na+ symporter
LTLAVLLCYLVVVLLIGGLSHRLFRGTSEDYFLATRTIGPFILLMSLFGTHMTSFSLLGASAESYRIGVGVFGLMASSSAIVVPVVFLLIGTRAWEIGKRHGYLTQIEFFRERWNSPALAMLLFLILVAFLIPYLLIGVMGGGITLYELTAGRVPEWLGGLLVCVVVLCYVTYGGLRGTAWVNTFQTLVFMTLGGIAFLVIVNKLGGLAHIMQVLADKHSDLLMRGDHVKPLQMLSYFLIPLSAGMFPHLYMHWLSAKSAASFKLPVILYPVCIAVVWLPSVLLGLMGRIDFPGLQGTASNAILVQMIANYAPDLLAGLLGAGVFAAVMSSLDSQVLAIGTMFTQDIVKHYGFHDKMTEKQQILSGRIFVAGILMLTYILSLISNRSIFKLGVWSFTGFASLLPVVLAALFWKRSTAAGVFAAIITTIICWAYYFMRSVQEPGYTVFDSGILPVGIILPACVLALIIVSLVTKPMPEQHLRKYFD